jgi:uncharacterized paraquat-inducible protein A
MTFLRIATFLKSLFWHIYSGSPKSSQTLIEHRFFICSACEFFDHKNKQCLQCGCNISNKKIFLNKLAWADQQCPIGLWHKEKI